MIGEFSYLPVDKIYFGAGSIEKLASVVAHYKSQQAVIITGQSLASKTPLVKKIEKLLGPTYSTTFSDIQQHVPEKGIESALRLVIDCKADLLVSIGGGSPIDAAKLVAYRMAHLNGSSSPPNYLTHIAIPTTLSAAEFSHGAGYTDAASGMKTGVSDPGIVPRVIFLDPEVTTWTPMWLLLASGIRSVDHAIETLYSPGLHPINDILAIRALELLFEFLPQSKGDPSNLEFRQECQMGAWMSNYAPLNSSSAAGLSHTIGKRIGATYGVPHGITSCVLLPHVIRYKSENPHAAACISPASKGMRLVDRSASDRDAALALAEAIGGLVQRLDLPSRLRDVNVPQDALIKIAASMDDDPAGRDGVYQILQNAW